MEKKKLEKEIQNEILYWLDKNGYFFWRSNNIPVYGKNNAGKYTFRALPKFTPRGLPDVIVLYKGTFVAIEVKREDTKGKLSDFQVEFGERVIMNGGVYVVARSLSDVKYILAGI